MILLIRFFLISLIVYLIVRSFTRYWNTEESPRQKPEAGSNDIKNGKKISKEIGEYVDYEEVDN
jgi:large-conductance mechanosensitive channel